MKKVRPEESEERKNVKFLSLWRLGISFAPSLSFLYFRNGDYLFKVKSFPLFFLQILPTSIFACVLPCVLYFIPESGYLEKHDMPIAIRYLLQFAVSAALVDFVYDFFV